MKNMNAEIIHVSTPDEIAVVERLAQEIWPQHFTSIIGASQVEYMLEEFQSAEAILSQISSGWKYYLVMVDNEMVGYAGLVPDFDAKRLMLSKIYVKKSARGKGVGKSILDFVERKCKLEGLSTLWLTVNRLNNGPISWYEDHGFVTIDEVKKDIGGGFIMDDYVMEKKIKIENA
ncbi:MAG: GNAT family N-acetyltransferase [Arenicellales bacterium]